jgi:hypothetical protein
MAVLFSIFTSSSQLRKVIVWRAQVELTKKPLGEFGKKEKRFNARNSLVQVEKSHSLNNLPSVLFI